jgi:hypothetical protein
MSECRSQRAPASRYRRTAVAGGKNLVASLRFSRGWPCSLRDRHDHVRKRAKSNMGYDRFGSKAVIKRAPKIGELCDSDCARRHSACLCKVNRTGAREPNPRTSALLVADFGIGRIRVNFQSLHGKELSLPTRRLIRSSDQLTGRRRSFRHEGCRGNFHDCHTLFCCCPTHISGLAVNGLGTHADPANRYSHRDARIAPGLLPRLPFVCFNPGPR